MPIFGLLGTVVVIFIGLRCPTATLLPSALDVARGAFGVSYCFSVNDYVLVAFFKRLTVFCDLNGLTIEDAN
jgi:hypothetical protein